RHRAARNQFVKRSVGVVPGLVGLLGLPDGHQIVFHGNDVDRLDGMRNGCGLLPLRKVKFVDQSCNCGDDEKPYKTSYASHDHLAERRTGSANAVLHSTTDIARPQCWQAVPARIGKHPLRGGLVSRKPPMLSFCSQDTSKCKGQGRAPPAASRTRCLLV